jgi:beta-1,4-mannooligosaccharide/beta-1,4-mannosyl-N-acetylglucosamine phosphorylase
MPLLRDGEPLITPRDIPALRPDLVDVTSVFNPGALRWRDREFLLLRVQTRGRTTALMPAEITSTGVEFLGPPLDLGDLDPMPAHVYDPRLTLLDETIYAVCAADYAESCALVTFATDDFERWRLIGVDAETDQRNGVLFPERVGGRYLRLERPNRVGTTGGPATGSRITCSASSDLLNWEFMGDVMDGRGRLWDEIIGSGPPPVKTREGWLHVYHGVATHFASVNIYQAGVVLLDLDEPWRVLHRGAFNILEPRTLWELTGQVPNVVFPSGICVDTVDGEGFALPESQVRIYYGAADTVVGRATATIADLIEDARFQG